MRIVILTQVAPNPPDAGPKIKTHYAIRMLAREHDVELITFARDEREVAAAEAMRPWCARVTTIPLRRRRVLEPYYLLRGWATGTPFLVARDARRAVGAALSARLAEGGVDVVHADQLSMAQYLPLARRAGVPTIFDAHNAVYDLVREIAIHNRRSPRGLAAAVEWRLLRQFEGGACRESTLSLAVSQGDATLLTAAAGAPFRTAIMPIGIEAAEVTPVPLAVDATRLLSVATMLYPPNIDALRWFRDAIWPLVAAAFPALTLDLVGVRPPADLVRWGEAERRVTVWGYVEELDALYRSAAIFIVPLRSGSGVRVKILEAMARGIPVVSTSIGVAGLDLQHGEHLMVADTPETFARAILTLLNAPILRAAMVQAARDRVAALYDWRHCYRPLLDAYRELGAGQPDHTSVPSRVESVAAEPLGVRGGSRT